MHYQNNGDISRFILRDGLLYITCWSKNAGVNRNGVFAESVEEVKACSDGQGMLYLFCLNASGDMDVYAEGRGRHKKSRIKTGSTDIILRDFVPYFSGDSCELIVSHSKKDNRNERILTKYTAAAEALTEGGEDVDYQVKDIMEYCTFGPVDGPAAAGDENCGSTVISVIEKNGEENSIILLRSSRFGYVEGLIKISMNSDIFWHDIMISGDCIITAYTIRDGGMFTIKYITYNTKMHTLSEEHTVRKKAACSHPVIIRFMGIIRLCWYENGAVFSCVINEKGAPGEPVKCRNSAGRSLLRADFIMDDESKKNSLDLCCRRVFMTYPDSRITGF